MTVSRFSDLPLADRSRRWNGAAAEKRVRKWAGAEKLPNARYRKAHLWYDAENERKIFVRAKNNLSAQSKDNALAYRFGAPVIGYDDEAMKEISAPYILWENDYVDVTATQAMRAAVDNRSVGELDKAKKFLSELLANGPVEADHPSGWEKFSLLPSWGPAAPKSRASKS